MSFLLRRLGVLLSLLGGAACSSPAAPKSLTHEQPPPPVSATLAFDDPATLKLASGASALLGVTATPPGAYSVGFALLGDPGDGTLDDALAFSDAAGHASVTLHAPTQPKTFSVQASVLAEDGTPTGVTAERDVAVSDEGFGSIRATPMYLGNRGVTTWSASVSTTTCAALQAKGELPGDPPGSLKAAAPLGGLPVVTGAPVGPSLAVAVRAGHFAWGCTDAQMLTAGATLDVTVVVVDKPIDLADAQVLTTFTFSPDPTAYPALLGQGVSALVEAFMPTSSSEGTIVLNGMAAATSDPATFAATRVADSWDALADQHFAALPEGLRDTCGAWATAGSALQPTSVVANLTGTFGGGVTIGVTQFGGLDAALAGAVASPGPVWSGQPDDGVLFSGGIGWEPSRFVGESALGPAQAAHPGASSVARALALAADCHGLAAGLGAFGSCTVDCVEALCVAAIASRWTAALDASNKASAPGQLAIQASASATVGDVAQPIALQGEWQGSIAILSSSLALKGGTLTATSGPPPTH